MNDQTSDYNIINILKDFKNIIKNKDDALALLLRLKQSLEFNATIDWHKLYAEISKIYKNPNPYYQSGEYTPDPINPIGMYVNDVFVFGSNTEGKHHGGAARVAVSEYGAILGQSSGLQGQSYGLITIDFVNDSVNLNTINDEIDKLISFAIKNQNLKFWVTKIGCGISGYTIEEIGSLFKYKIIPPNVILPEEFVNVILHQKFLFDTENEVFYKVLGPNNVLAVKIVMNEMFICEKEINIASINNLIVCTEDEFVNATETVLKTLYK
jgi:hypothetical protein